MSPVHPDMAGPFSAGGLGVERNERAILLNLECGHPASILLDGGIEEPSIGRDREEGGAFDIRCDNRRGNLPRLRVERATEDAGLFSGGGVRSHVEGNLMGVKRGHENDGDQQKLRGHAGERILSVEETPTAGRGQGRSGKFRNSRTCASGCSAAAI